MFNKARDTYNNEDIGDIQIRHYPFSKYKMPTAPETNKRNLDKDVIVKIRDYTSKHRLDEFARDVFMISFYLIGMNTVDLYNCKIIGNGRIEYNRTKTEGKRKDRAFISIKIQDELKPFVEKYRGKHTVFDFSERYANAGNFNKHVNVALNRIGKELKLPMSLTTYYARHSWATIARNDCRISKDDVHMAMNHSDSLMKVTDIYIAKDWSIIDDANRKVIDFLFRVDDQFQDNKSL